MAETKFIKKGTSIRHRSGTSSRSPECKKCGSWIQHWENHTSNNTNQCCLCCEGKKEVGAHVIIDDIRGEWIIPTCTSCNSSGGECRTVRDVCAVSAIQC